MLYFVVIANENNVKHLKWSDIPDHPYRTLKIGGSVSGKITTWLNLIREQDNDELIERFIYMLRT